jgi:uroporphyrinogen-III synthase
MKRVLVLRPEPGASATAKRARHLGLHPVVLPLFEVEPVAWQLPDLGDFDGLLLTSANAMRHGGDKLELLHGLPVYSVGAATADAARSVGFDVTVTGDSDLEHLLGSIPPELKLLHLAGEHRTPAPHARQRITSLTVYRSVARDGADLGAVQDSVALIHSPRAGRRLAELMERQGVDTSRVAIAAISRNAASAAGLGWAAVETAAAPNDEALLALAASLCNNSAPQ